ncbi:MAG: DUF1194 domain-containing protein [Pseudomonadota bacterium]
MTWMLSFAPFERSLAQDNQFPSYFKAQKKYDVDTALIISVDVSQSVDAERYALQMEGIARALEDPDVVGAIVSAPLGRILFMMIAWADSPKIVVPWTWIASPDDAIATANLVRNVPQQGGEFTCLARMLRIVNESVLPTMPKRARRVVLDVSSDGIDNCTPAPQVDEARDRLIGNGVMINGNPIMIPGENDTVGVGAYRKPGYGLAVGPDTEMTTMEKWYTAHVMGGPGAFVLPAYGYRDFGRAIRKKFMMEVTEAPLLPQADQGLPSLASRIPKG